MQGPRDARVHGRQEGGPRRPLRRGWRRRVLHQEGGLAGIPGSERHPEAAGAAVYFALEEQGEPAAGLGLEGHAEEEEEPAS